MSARTGNSPKTCTAVAAAWLACFCSAMSVEYVVDIGGEIYPLRMGLIEGDSDLVFPPPDTSPKWEYVEKAVCFKAGSRVGVRIRWDPGEQPCVWAVTDSMLYSQLTSAIYWTESACDAPGGHGMHPPNDIHWFPESVPDFVDHARLIGEVVTCAPVEPPMFGGWTNKRKSEVFIVLDEPKPPMSPAWVTFLRYTCKWARYRPGEGGISYWDAETRNFYDGTQRITFGMFFQRPGLAYPAGTETAWVEYPTLYLKMILDKWSAGQYAPGNCVDSACVNMTAMCSIGIDFSVRGLTGDLQWMPNPHPPPDWIYVFESNPICPIGSNPTSDATYRPFHWAWHLVCVPVGEAYSHSSRIWDNTAAHRKNLSADLYRNPPAHYPPGGHLWPQKDYWQKYVGSEILGVVRIPFQTAGAPYPYGGDWKCDVSTDQWPRR